jgi:hypothetical protein
MFFGPAKLAVSRGLARGRETASRSGRVAACDATTPHQLKMGLRPIAGAPRVPKTKDGVEPS